MEKHLNYLSPEQASLTSGALRLERALDEKERELQLQRAEIHGLRERLRAAETSKKECNSVGNNANNQPCENEVISRAGTAPYPDPNESRPVSPEGCSVDNAPTRAGMENNGWKSKYRDRGKNSAPPGAHLDILRPPRGYAGGVGQADPELYVSASGST